MTTTSSDTARIDQMLKDGKISEHEAHRLRDSLHAQQVRDEIFIKRIAARANSSRRRVTMLLIVCGAFFVTGLVGGRLWLQQPNTVAIPVTEHTAQGPATASGNRTIDLQVLNKERSKTMGNARSFSTSIFVIVIAGVVGVAILLIYNGLVDAREKVNAGWAQVENQYQRRLDLVPVLIDGVKTYMEHERETLTALTEARANALGATSALAGQPPQTSEQLRVLEASQGDVKSALTRLFAVVENYPDLKASQNFLTLQDQIEGSENRIAVERRNYNEFSRRYNAKTLKFPSNVIADLLGFEAKPYFQAESAAMEGLSDPFGKKR